MKTFIKTLISLTLVLFTLFFFSNKVFAVTVFSDSFTGVNGTELSQYNPNWTPRFTGLANSYITNNELQGLYNNSGYYYSALPKPSNVCVNLDFHSEWGNASWVSLETRYSNTSGEHSYIGSIDNKSSYSLGKDYSAIKSGTIPTGDLDTNLHHLALCSQGFTQTLYLDNTPLNSFTDNSYSQGYVGFDTGPNTFIDNFVVTSIDSSLNVPLLKQNNPFWGKNIYDFANKWSPRDTSISSWGCALTSAAMVFQYHGIKKLPNGSNLDPGTLNAWLKTQKDGYIRNGLVNWLALSRLSKAAKNINNLPFDALEYTRKNTSNHSTLDADINAGLPDILQEPGHFIVAKGINGTTYDINDPFYNRNLLTDHYNNTFNSLGTYKPSNTDLSYIMLVVNKDIDLSLSGGNSSDGQLFLNEYINNAQDNNKNTEKLNVYYLPKPQAGKYNIKLNSNSTKTFRIDVYLYDKDGNVSISKQKGIIKNDGANIELTYPKRHSEKCSYVSTILDLHKKNEITDEKLKMELTQLLIKAKVQNVMGDRENELSYLDDFSELLIEHESSMSPEKFSDLERDIDYLSSNN